MAKKPEDFLDASNANIIAEMVADPDTPDFLRVQMINKMLESRKSENFFASMFTEKLSFGACPNCQHETHWLIPETDLNQMGWVSHEKDSRVQRTTTEKDCSSWAEACSKKKISV